MNRRMTMATTVAGIALSALAGCGTSDSDGAVTSPSKTATPPAVTTQAPSVDPDTDGAVDLRGDWEIKTEDYVLHLVEDGTFIQDYMGIEDFRTGKYSVKGRTIWLVGDDGDTDKGTIVGDTLQFTLGTATRVK
jgi:hypothetical protein